VEKYERIDGLVCNAGVLLRRTPEEMTEKEWDFMMDVNLKGTFLFNREAGKQMMRQNKGTIVNIASIGGKVALSLRLGYCTSKAGVEHFTRVIANEWGKYNIRLMHGTSYIISDMNAVSTSGENYKQMVDMCRWTRQQELVLLFSFCRMRQIL
jgi:NAD(P)-dependent dehydrogenase (short-subunit alcohol dehydrogenase family)